MDTIYQVMHEEEFQKLRAEWWGWATDEVARLEKLCGKEK